MERRPGAMLSSAADFHSVAKMIRAFRFKIYWLARFWEHELTNREERIRLFVSYLNIVAAGTLVGALVTEPLAWAANANVADIYRITFEVVSIIASAGVELIAQFIVWKFLP